MVDMAAAPHASTLQQLDHDPQLLTLFALIHSARKAREVLGPNSVNRRKRDAIVAYAQHQGRLMTMATLGIVPRSDKLATDIDDVLAAMGPRPDERDFAKVHWDVTAVRMLAERIGWPNGGSN